VNRVDPKSFCFFGGGGSIGRPAFMRLEWDTEKMWSGAHRNKTSLMGRVASRPISVQMSSSFGGSG